MDTWLVARGNKPQACGKPFIHCKCPYHRLSISLTAILWTAIGFALIKLAAFMILSGRIAGEEIGSLLTGFLGTLLFFFGLRSFLGLLAGRAGREKKLHTFTFRQLQENVIHRSHALAISSLLILAALCCFGTGVAVALVYGDSEQHVLDYTFPCPDAPSVIREQLSAAGFSDTFGSLFEMKVGHIPPAEDNTPRFSMDAVLKALEGLPESEDRDVLLNNFSDGYTPRLIALSGYNQLLAAAGLPEITLSGNEARSIWIRISPAITGLPFATGSLTDALRYRLQAKPFGSPAMSIPPISS